jgi:hypothetical protein
MNHYRCLLALFLILVSSAPFAAAADNELTEQERAAGWRLLFNGQDTTGWKCNNGKPVAAPVEDGCLAPYKAGGYLIVYDEKFEDFKLACDVKMSADNCNSGVFVRVSDLAKPVYSGIEIQVYKGGTDMHSFGAIYDLVSPSKNVVKPVGEWNHLEVTCRGPNVAVVVNGDEVAKINCDDYAQPGLRPNGTKHKFGVAIKDLPRSGYLGFQDHGHKVWYKNVKLLVLRKE